MPKKLQSRKRVIQLLDNVVSQYVRLSNADHNGDITCISCEQKIPRQEAHCCHRISRGCLMYRRDLNNLAPGCPGCNTYRPEYHLREYTIKQIDKLGMFVVNLMRSNEKKIYKISTPDLREMLKQWKEKLDNLKKSKKDLQFAK